MFDHRQSDETSAPYPLDEGPTVRDGGESGLPSSILCGATVAMKSQTPASVTESSPVADFGSGLDDQAAEPDVSRRILMATMPGKAHRHPAQFQWRGCQREAPHADGGSGKA